MTIERERSHSTAAPIAQSEEVTSTQIPIRMSCRIRRTFDLDNVKQMFGCSLHLCALNRALNIQTKYGLLCILERA